LSPTHHHFLIKNTARILPQAVIARRYPPSQLGLHDTATTLEEGSVDVQLVSESGDLVTVSEKEARRAGTLANLLDDFCFEEEGGAEGGVISLPLPFSMELIKAVLGFNRTFPTAAAVGHVLHQI
jgi:hypothetical protein